VVDDTKTDQLENLANNIQKIENHNECKITKIYPIPSKQISVFSVILYNGN
jgi:hypothetical protein